MYRVIVCLSICFASTFSQSQTLFETQSQQSTVLGRIIAGSTKSDNFMIVVEPTSVDGVVQKVPVSRNGSFSFDAIVGQSYLIRVWDKDDAVYQQIVTADPRVSIDISIPEPQVVRHTTGTISLYELQHKVPPKAGKEGGEADKCASKHDMKGYIQHAEKAVALDPDWTVARRNLGIGYLLLGDNEKAAEQFQEVLQRDPRSVPAYAALSAAYLQMDQLPEAEAAARQAVLFDSSSEPGRYYLGLSLAFQHKDDSKALQYLKKVSDHFPKARIAAAEILERLGMKQAAKGELEAYLATGNSDARSQVKSLLSSLK